MAEKQEFTQDGVTTYIAQLKEQSDDKRKVAADELRDMGLKAYIFDKFELTEGYADVIKNFDDSFADEMTYSMALAIEKKNWSLVIKFPPVEPTVGMRCQQTTQTVSGSYNPQGGYTITKTAGWTFSK